MKKLTPGKAIKLNCFDCHGYHKKETKKCSFTTCPLYPHRLGKNPNRTGYGNNAFQKMTDDSKKDPVETDCPVLSAKISKDEALRIRVANPLKAIRMNCLSCMVDSAHEINDCVSMACPLYLFRFGRRPTLEELEIFLQHPPTVIGECESDKELIEQNKLIIKSVRQMKEEKWNK